MSKKYDVVIVGGGVAGNAAAMTARRYNPNAKIALIRREQRALVPCGIPYIYGTLRSVDDNLISDAFLQRRNVDIVLDQATKIDREKKTVALSSGGELEYDKLIIATGSLPAKPPIPGLDLKNCFFVYKDAEYLRELMNALGEAKKVVVIGGGFIGVEFADEFRKRGLDVTIVEILPHCLQIAFDDEFCEMAEKRLSESGVKLMTNCRVEEVVGTDRVEKVKLSTGETLEADLVLVGVGAVPNTELARDAGLKIGEQRGIWVDEYMRTSDEDVFAAGDCAEKFSFFTKKPIGLRLASIAAREARIAGVNVFGLRRRNEGTIGCFSTVVGNLALGAVGLIERAAKEAGINYVVGSTSIPDKHPATMPGTGRVWVKLLFDKSSKALIGGQVAGGIPTAEIANMLSFMVEKRATAEEVATFQYGTHPMLTGTPVAYQVADAAEDALTKL